MTDNDQPEDRAVPPDPPRQRALWRRVLLSALLMVLMWPIISLPAAVLVYLLIPPKYEAFALLRVDNPPLKLFSEHPSQIEDHAYVNLMLATYVSVITSDDVLESVAASPLTRDQAILKNATDPKDELRSRLSVEILPDTRLIRIALESTDPEEAATLVNQVVESCLTAVTHFHSSRNTALKQQLISLRQSLTTEIEDFTARSPFQRHRITAMPSSPPTTPATDQPKRTAAQEREQILEDVKLLDDVKLTHELTSLLDMRTTVDKTLRQLEFEIKIERFPVELQDAAAIPKTPSSTARIQWTIYTLIAMFFVLLAIFCIRWSMPRRRRLLPPGENVQLSSP